MRIHSKLLLAALTATVLMSLAVSAAQARRMFYSLQRYQAIWNLLRFEVQGFATVECPVTIEGSFASQSISKVSGLLIVRLFGGKVRGGRTECNNTGTARVNSETLPWHVRFLFFIDPLPDITGIAIQLVGLSFNIDPEGAAPNCRIGTTTSNPFKGILQLSGVRPNFNVSTLRADETRTVPVGGEFFCEISATNAAFRGTAEVFSQGSTTTRITVKLIQ